MFRSNLLSKSLVVAAFVGACSLTTGCYSAAHSAPVEDAHTNVVIVIGKGEVSRKPDIARTTMGISVAAPTVAEASRLANQQMTNLIAAIKKEGIAEKDIQTANFSINFERIEPPHFPPPVPTPPGKPGSGAVPMPAPAPARAAGQYRVSNTVRVTIRDLDKAGHLLDAAVAAGANEVWGVTFEIEKPEPLAAEARDKAAQDARAHAEALAKAQGRTLGDVVSVSESVGGGVRPMPAPYMAKTADMGSIETPVAPGEVAVSAQLEVVYRLAKK